MKAPNHASNPASTGQPTPTSPQATLRARALARALLVTLTAGATPPNGLGRTDTLPRIPLLPPSITTNSTPNNHPHRTYTRNPTSSNPPLPQSRPSPSPHRPHPHQQKQPRTLLIDNSPRILGNNNTVTLYTTTNLEKYILEALTSGVNVEIRTGVKIVGWGNEVRIVTAEKVEEEGGKEGGRKRKAEEEEEEEQVVKREKTEE